MRHSIDTQGLFFGLKFMGVLCALFLLAYGGGQVVGARMFTDPELSVRQVQAELALEQVRAKTALKSIDSHASSSIEKSIENIKVREELTMISTSTPATSARALLVADIDTGQIYYEKDATAALPIASVTKLMTATIASELIPLSAYVRHEGSGNEYLAGDMLYPLFLRSDNTAADSFADYYGRNEFLAKMNQKAQELGMAHTHFGDPSGLSPKNVASAADLFYLAQYVYLKKSFLLEVSREERKKIIARSGVPLVISNQNQFAEDGRFIGGKLGFTDEALQTSVGLFSINVLGEKHTLAVIVLGSYNWKQDTHTLVSWFTDASAPAKSAVKLSSQL